MIVTVLLSLVVAQNLPFFLEPKHLQINFMIFEPYSTPEFPMAFYFLVLFLGGLLISYASGLSEKFIAKKTIRNLNNEVAAAKKKISELQENIKTLKTEATQREAEMPVPPADAPEATQP